MPTIKLILPDSLTEGATYALMMTGDVPPVQQPSGATCPYTQEQARLGNQHQGALGFNTKTGERLGLEAIASLGLTVDGVNQVGSTQQQAWAQFVSSCTAGFACFSQPWQGEGADMAKKNGEM